MTAGWCLVAGREIFYTGDRMIGFHPLLLFLLPLDACLLFAAVAACVMSRWRFAALAMVSCVLVMVFSSQRHRISRWGWDLSIARYDSINREAILKTSGIPDFTDETLVGNISNDQACPVVEGFVWYCNHDLAAPDGAFRAFRYRGVVHVRIQKTWHGYRGIALLDSPSDAQKLAKDSELVYERAVGDKWLIWRCE
ncbi:MAG TPA: hypothetical protein DCM87_06060 [Planctomycetes bacterium]|nr:hypothetical protein [Planctomycetota bacterium]